MKTKRIILIILLLTLGVLIFSFSNENGKNSNKTSDKVMNSIIDVYEDIRNTEVSKERRVELVNKTRVLVRKLAHFSLYFILGMLVYILLTTFNLKHPVILAILFSLFYASTDEFHQLFIDGRTSSVIDIFLDTFGSIVGVVFCNIPKIFKKEQKQ